MSTTGDVHVGDVGTRYKGELQDVGVAFDPSLAGVKRLTFQTPTGVVHRDATVTTTGTGAAQKWFLEYVVLPADVAAGIHKRQGTYRWQGLVEFPTGERYSTNIESYEVAGNLC